MYYWPTGFLFWPTTYWPVTFLFWPGGTYTAVDSRAYLAVSDALTTYLAVSDALTTRLTVSDALTTLLVVSDEGDPNG